MQMIQNFLITGCSSTAGYELTLHGGYRSLTRDLQGKGKKKKHTLKLVGVLILLYLMMLMHFKAVR